MKKIKMNYNYCMIKEENFTMIGFVLNRIKSLKRLNYYIGINN